MGMSFYVVKFPPPSFLFLSSPFYTNVSVSPLCCGLPSLCMSIPLIADTFKEPGVATDTYMPTTTSPAVLVSPVSAIPSAPVSAVPTVSISIIPTTLVPTIFAASTLTGPVCFFLSSLSSLLHCEFVLLSSWFLTPCFMFS